MELDRITKTVYMEIMKQQDEYMKSVIIQYAKRRSKETGQEIEVLFMDEEVANEIIDLGVEAYRKNNPHV